MGELVVVIAGNFREFLFHFDEKAREAPAGTPVVLRKTEGRGTIGGTTYRYIGEPDRLRGLKPDRVEKWGLYTNRRDLEEMEMILRTRGLSLWSRPVEKAEK